MINILDYLPFFEAGALFIAAMVGVTAAKLPDVRLKARPVAPIFCFAACVAPLLGILPIIAESPRFLVVDMFVFAVIPAAWWLTVSATKHSSAITNSGARPEPASMAGYAAQPTVR